jgi:hypothetical protein
VGAVECETEKMFTIEQSRALKEKYNLYDN